jgi:hypothetical protein
MQSVARQSSQGAGLKIKPSLLRVENVDWQSIVFIALSRRVHRVFSRRSVTHFRRTVVLQSDHIPWTDRVMQPCRKDTVYLQGQKT